jgi:hypothetical protein
MMKERKMRATLLRLFAAALTGLFLVGAYAQETQTPSTQADCEAAGGTWNADDMSCTMAE